MSKVVNIPVDGNRFIVDMPMWLAVNMFIDSQMIMSSDSDGNFVIEDVEFLPN